MAMSDFFIGAGGTAGGVPSSYAQVSPLTNDPFSQLYNQTKSLIPTDIASLGALISQGMNSPLLSAIIGPALQKLTASEDASRQAVTDAFRASGGLRSSQYGRTYAQNEGNILNTRSGLISDTIAKNLATIVPGLLQEQKNSFLPGEEYMNLMKLIRPDLVSLPGVNGGGGGVNYGYTDLGTPSIFDPAYSQMLSSWQSRVTPQYGASPGLTGVNAGTGGGVTPATTPAPNPYGGYGFDQGYPTTYNSNTGAYNTYSSPGPYQDPASYYAQFGMGYQAPAQSSNPNISYGPWTDVISGEY